MVPHRLAVISGILCAAACACSAGTDSTKSESVFLKFLKGVPDSPYRLSWKVDVPLAATSASLLLLRQAVDIPVELYTADDLSRFSPEDVPRFDRWAIGPRNEEIDQVSWYTNGIVVNHLWILFIGRNGRRDIVKIAAMYAEAYLMYPLVTSWINPLIGRKRPYFYSEEERLENRLNPAAQSSIPSGHTSYAFCFAMLSGCLFNSYYPDSPWRFVVWGTALGTATTTAVLRVAAHYHYPTDVLVGAATGSLIGWFIPWMHSTKRRFNRVSLDPAVINGHTGLRLRVAIPCASAR